MFSFPHFENDMRKRLGLGVVVMALAGAIAYATRYQITTAHLGNTTLTVRTNRYSGASAILVADGGAWQWQRITPSDGAPRAASVGMTPLYAAHLAQRKVWPVIWLPDRFGKATATIATSWRDGQLYYQLSLTPPPRGALDSLSDPLGLFDSDYARAIQRLAAVTRYDLDFVDSVAFRLLSVPIPHEQIARRVRDDGTTTVFVAAASVPCTPDLYRRIATVGIEWR